MLSLAHLTIDKMCQKQYNNNYVKYIGLRGSETVDGSNPSQSVYLNQICEFSRARKFLHKKHRVRVAAAIKYSAVRSVLLIFPDKQERELKRQIPSIKKERGGFCIEKMHR